MGKGVVGFRIDALRQLYESDLFLDEPCLTEGDPLCSVIFGCLNHTYTMDQPETIEIIKEWREFIDNYTRSNNIPMSR